MYWQEKAEKQIRKPTLYKTQSETLTQKDLLIKYLQSYTPMYLIEVGGVTNIMIYNDCRSSGTVRSLQDKY